MEDKNSHKKTVPGSEKGPEHTFKDKTQETGTPDPGVTSGDPAEKEEMEKKGSLAKVQSSSQKQENPPAPKNYLTKEDIPDSTNESTGVPGSGQRQDSN